MESSEQDALINKIERSSRRNVSNIDKEVKSALNKLTGGKNNCNMLKGDSFRNAIIFVQTILSTIDKRIMSLPYVDLFHTYKECLSYYQHLCKEKGLLAYMKRRCDFIECCEHWNEYEQGAAEAYDVLLGIDQLSEEQMGEKLESLILPRQGTKNSNETTALCVLRVSYFFLCMWRDISTNYKHYYVEMRNILKELEAWLR